jgi:hypothetical protein
MVRVPGGPSSRGTIRPRPTRDGGGCRGMVRAPGGPSSRGTIHPRDTPRRKEVAGGWFVPPDHNCLPATRSTRGLPAVEEVAGGWFVPPDHNCLPATRSTRGLPAVEEVAGGWFVPPDHNCLPATRSTRGLPAMEEVTGGWFVPRWAVFPPARPIRGRPRWRRWAVIPAGTTHPRATLSILDLACCDASARGASYSTRRVRNSSTVRPDRRIRPRKSPGASSR